MELSKKRKWIIAIAGTALLMVLVLALLASRGKDPVVQVVSVTREDLTETITSNGIVEPISPMIAHAEFATFVDKVMATAGQSVRRGQVILTLDAADVRSELAKARAGLLAAQTDLRNARTGGPPDDVAHLQSDLQQTQVEVSSLEQKEKALERLVTEHAATGDELAQTQASLAKARAHLREDEQKKEAMAQQATVSVESAGLTVGEQQELVQSLEEKVRSATVTASSDGTLYSLPVRTGDYVKVGDTLAEMADLGHVRVRAFVDEPDLGWLAPNQEVQVTWDAKLGQTWAGSTEQIPKEVVSHGMRSVGEVLCSVGNDNLALLPNVNVEVRILVRQRQGALVIPRAAVQEDNGQHYVFVLSDGQVSRHNITVGISSATNYEVVSGLALGTRVAVPGNRELQDGMEVRPEVTN
jgi:HlyD family secretion protein